MLSSPHTVSSTTNRVPRSRALSLHAWLIILGTVALTVFLMADQGKNGGFSRGHHGWVSAHSMSIASHVAPENGYLGYANVSISEDGKIRHHYFDRFPVWQAALTNGLIESQGSFSNQVMTARTLMNVFFIMTFVSAYLLLFRLFADRMVALSATLLAMSSYYIAEYRDMVQYDMPPLLSLLLVGHVILNAELRGKLGWSAFLIVIAVSLGSGMAVIPALAAWCLFDLYRALKSDGTKQPSVTRWIFAAPFKAALTAVTLSTLYLSYNVAFEAKIRNVSVVETSIIDSAARRLGLVEKFEQQKRNVSLTWRNHVETQLHRVATSMLPYPPFANASIATAVPYYTGRLGLSAQLAATGFLILVIALTGRRLPPPKRIPFFILAASGILWLTPMKNLAIPHEYTTIYHIGALLAFFAGVASILCRLRHGKYLVALASLALFLASTHSVNLAHVEKAQVEDAFSADFDRIAKAIPPGAHVYVAGPHEIDVDDSPDVVPGVPYATAFYLHRQLLSLSPAAPYIVTRDAKYDQSHPCTIALMPTNTRAFLYRNVPCKTADTESRVVAQ